MMLTLLSVGIGRRDAPARDTFSVVCYDGLHKAGQYPR